MLSSRLRSQSGYYRRDGGRGARGWQSATVFFDGRQMDEHCPKCGNRVVLDIDDWPFCTACFKCKHAYHRRWLATMGVLFFGLPGILMLLLGQLALQRTLEVHGG